MDVYTLADIKRIVEPIAKNYGVGKIDLFGSYARGEARSNSDIDLIITDKGRLHGLFQLSSLWEDLQDSLGVSVDLTTEGGVWPEILENIKKEAVNIYGA
jgi:predicted nucleotidyltransferase